MVYIPEEYSSEDEMLSKLPNLDSFSTATIDEQFPDIGVWEIAQQVVLRDPETREPYIHHRMYSIPILPLSNPYYVREVEIPYEEWPKYYRVETEFQVEDYNSGEEFFKWERGVQTYTLEIFKYNRKSSFLNWVRPPELLAPVPPILDTLEGGGLITSKPGDPRTIAHPPVTLALSTGKALGVEVVLSNGEPEGDPNKPWLLDMSNSKTVPISLGDIKVEYPQGTTMTGKFNVFPSDVVYVTTTAYSVKAVFYGEETYQTTSYPTRLIDDTEDEVLVHPPSAPFTTRLLPPGKNFRQDFWNNPGGKDPELKGYQNRVNKQWEIGTQGSNQGGSNVHR